MKNKKPEYDYIKERDEQLKRAQKGVLVDIFPDYSKVGRQVVDNKPISEKQQK